jgi:hypothetical protein
MLPPANQPLTSWQWTPHSYSSSLSTRPSDSWIPHFQTSKSYLPPNMSLGNELNTSSFYPSPSSLARTPFNPEQTSHFFGSRLEKCRRDAFWVNAPPEPLIPMRIEGSLIQRALQPPLPYPTTSYAPVIFQVDMCISQRFKVKQM